jgi:hypothetical protein
LIPTPPTGDIACAPTDQPIYLYGEKAYVVPVTQFFNAVTERRLQVGDILAKCFNTALANLIGGALGNEKSALPVFFAIDHDEHSAGFDVTEG